VNPASQSDTAPLHRVLLKHARDAFVSDMDVARQWKDLRYTERPDFTRAVSEYERFVELLRRAGADPYFLPRNTSVGLDSLYVRDASIITGRGAILCNMGKPQRRTEPAAQEQPLRDLGVAILGRIAGDGTVEGGDVAWLDPRTLAVGHGYRTNAAGIEQLRALLADQVDDLVIVPLVHWRGPDDVFHLMSVISPIDRDLALVYSPLLPVPFRQGLLERGYELVEVPDAEFPTLGCNVLAVAPRMCVMVEGNPETKRRLLAAGCDVLEFRGREICVKGGGGPTCLTRPLLRG